MLKKIIFFIIFFVAAERFCYLQTGGFNPNKIIVDLPSDPTCPIIKAAEENYFIQPFYYLDKGVQFYAFLSADGQTVLKIVKQKHSRPSDWLASLSGNHEQQNTRREKIFESCKIAYDMWKKETGLLYLHLTPQENAIPIVLYDNLGIAHTVDLNMTSFALQKKAELLVEKFEGWKKEGKKEAAKEKIDALLQLIIKRCQLGIYNSDARLRNFGYIEDQAIEIDLGSFTIDQQLEWKKMVAQETAELKKWFSTHDPELLSYLNQKIHEI